MANTITQQTVYGSATSKLVVRAIHISSDGSEETDLILYDNSAFINDVSKGSLMKVIVIGSAANFTLKWDQTTDSTICLVNVPQALQLDFSDFGGIHNPNGTGATGDLLLSTANLDNGDLVSMFLYIRQD